jgi:hypothetical protein
VGLTEIADAAGTIRLNLCDPEPTVVSEVILDRMRLTAIADKASNHSDRAGAGRLKLLAEQG